MPNNIHHVSVQTLRSAELVQFATRVLGMGQVTAFTVSRNDIAPLMGWSQGPGSVSSTILGGGKSGLLEVLEIPPDVPDGGEFTAGTSGILQLCLQVNDLDSTLSASRRFPADEIRGPFEIVVGRATVQVGLVWFGGVRFQLTEISDR
jgi:hypothetical protein